MTTSPASFPAQPPLPADPLAQALQAAGRIATSPIGSPEKLRAVLSGLTLDLAELREQLRGEGHPQWWRLADAVDDLLDIYEAQFGALLPAQPPARPPSST